MIKRCVHFAVELKKQSLLDNDVLFNRNTKKLCDINNTVFMKLDNI